MQSWIGVDLDGTLAYYTPGNSRKGIIGEPIQSMLIRVKKMLDNGCVVKIFTGRVSQDPNNISLIQDWLESHGLPRLEVTNIKDHFMTQLWDDRAIAVEYNTGRILNV